MNRDVLGKKELERIKLNWNFAGPGLMDGRCYATGTCDNQPTTSVRKKYQKTVQVLQIEDASSAEEVRLLYGYLRS